MRGFQFPYHSSNGKNSKIKLKKGCEIMSEKDNKIDQIIRTIEENDVKFLKLQISDIHGLPKSMAVPLKKADDIEDIVNDGLLFDGSSIAGLASINDSDLLAKPDINTFSTIPWRPESKGTSRFICDVYTTEGKPYDGDPRGVLKRALEKAEKRGYQFNRSRTRILHH
jgi:glutamine synthetase